jgi:voltage-gated potassium channel
LEEGSPVFRSLVFLVVITLLGGTIFYSTVEGWSIVDAFYFSVTTLTTVGLGDLTSTTTISKLFTVVYIFAGLSIILGFLDTVAKETLRYQGGTVARRAEKLLQAAETEAFRRTDEPLGAQGSRLDHGPLRYG